MKENTQTQSPSQPAGFDSGDGAPGPAPSLVSGPGGATSYGDWYFALGDYDRYFLDVDELGLRAADDILMENSPLLCAKTRIAWVATAAIVARGRAMDRDSRTSSQVTTCTREPIEMGRARKAKCGTRSGYMRHLRRGEETCQACRRANHDYQRPRNEAARRARGVPELAPAICTRCGAHWKKYRDYRCPGCDISTYELYGKVAQRAQHAATTALKNEHPERYRQLYRQARAAILDGGTR